MKENFNLYYKGVPNEDQELVSNVVENKSQKGTETYVGEFEKTEEELKAIDFINNYIQAEIKQLGLEPRSPIPYERVHIINKEIAKSIGLTSDGGYHSTRDSVDIVKDNFKKGRIFFYETLLHEILHYYSYSALIAIDSTKKIEPYRSGYKVKNPDSIDDHEHFRGFNEAVIEKVLRDILIKNQQDLLNNFNITKDEIKKKQESIPYYFRESSVLDIIIVQMAKHLQRDPLDVWNEIKKGLYTGEMMHLRKIEEVFGPSSLRVLGAMSSHGSYKNINKEELFYNIKLFFEEKNQGKRDILAKKILSERERLKYDQHKKNLNK